MAESVGWKLQQARLARRLEIEDVAETTKIRPERIIDLEADEYGHFPNLTYAKSFLAKYAKFLGVDIQDELDKFRVDRTISLAAYPYLTGPPVPKQILEPRRITPRGFRVPWLPFCCLLYWWGCRCFHTSRLTCHALLAPNRPTKKLLRVSVKSTTPLRSLELQ